MHKVFAPSHLITTPPIVVHIPEGRFRSYLIEKFSEIISLGECDLRGGAMDIAYSFVDTVALCTNDEEQNEMIDSLMPFVLPKFKVSKEHLIDEFKEIQVEIRGAPEEFLRHFWNSWGLYYQSYNFSMVVGEIILECFKETLRQSVLLSISPDSISVEGARFGFIFDPYV
jgi:hypothetical protein